MHSGPNPGMNAAEVRRAVGGEGCLVGGGEEDIAVPAVVDADGLEYGFESFG